MSNEVSIVVRAKNMMAAGLKSATRDLNALGARAVDVGRGIASGFAKVAGVVAGVGTALVTAGGAAVKAYAESQKAEQDLTSAIQSHGQSVDALLPKYKALADEIQRKTAIDDEQVLSTIALLTNYGVTAGKMDQAVRAAVGLSKALGVDLSTAAKAAANAVDGDYQALARYIPALNNAKTEAEKAALVQQLLTSGYKQAEDGLNTLAGRYAEIKGAAGNFVESLGEIIAKNANVQSGMGGVAERIREAQAAMEGWASGGGLDSLIMQTRLFGVHFAATSKSVLAYIESWWGGLKMLASPIQYVGNLFGAMAAAVVADIELAIDSVKALGRALLNPVDTLRNGLNLPDRTPSQEAKKNVFKSLVTKPEWMSTDWIDEGAAKQSKIRADEENARQAIYAADDRALQRRLAGERKSAVAGVGAVDAAAEANKKAQEEAAAKQAALDAQRLAEERAAKDAADRELAARSLSRELQNVAAVDRERSRLDAQRAQLEAAKELASLGQPVTAESVMSNGLIATKQASDMEAERIAAIIQAVQSAMGGGDGGGQGGTSQIDVLMQIEENTARIADTIPEISKIG